MSNWIKNYVAKFYQNISCTNILVMPFHSSSESHFCCEQHSITGDVVCCCVGQFVTFPIYVSVDLALCCSIASSASLPQKPIFLFLNKALPLLWHCLLIAWNMIFYSFVSLLSYCIISHFIISCMFNCWLPVCCNYYDYDCLPTHVSV